MSTSSAPPARISWTILSLIAFLATVLRILALGRRELVEGDGVHYASLARLILLGDGSGLANPYWSNLWPGVIAAASSLTRLDVVAAGRLVSMICGVALAVLTARLGARAFDQRVGILAGLAVAVHPWLAQFSTLVFTESFFSLLIVSVLLAALPLFDEPRMGSAILSGAFCGAALATRPEAYGMLAALGLTVVVAAWRRRAMRKVMPPLMALLATVALFAVGRAFLIHAYFGEWNFGIDTKGAANLLIGMAPNDPEKIRIYSEITSTGASKLETWLHQWTLVSFTLAHPGVVLAHLGRNLLLLADCARRVFPPLPVSMGREAFFGTPLWTALDVGSIVCLGLAGWGAFDRLRRAPGRGPAALCAAVFTVHLAGLAPLYVHARMIVAVEALFLLFFAQGAVRLWDLLRLPPLEARTAVGLALPFAILTAYGLGRAPWFDYASEPPVQKQAGLWLREHFPQDSRLMTFTPTIAFYFYDGAHQANEIGLPWAEYPLLLNLARRERVDVVAAAEWQLASARFPTAAQLTPAGEHPGLTYVASLGVEPRRVHIFRVEGLESP